MIEVKNMDQQPVFYIENGRVLNAKKQAILKATLPKITTFNDELLGEVKDDKVLNSAKETIGTLKDNEIVNSDDEAIGFVTGKPQANYPLGAAVYLLFDHGDLG